MRSAPRIVCLAGLLSACLPDDAPYWLIDHPINWGIRISVVQPGGYASGLVVPEGQVRASALPLDTIELEWLAVAPPGTELAPPIWVLCPFGCSHYPPPIEAQLPGSGLKACELPVQLWRLEMCRLGEGQRLTVTLAGAYTSGFAGELALMTVGSGSDEVDPETCLQRLLSRPQVGLEACLIMSRSYYVGTSGVGPGLPPSDAMPELPDDEPEPPVPPEQAPDTHPVVDGFWVTRESPAGRQDIAVADGADVPVRAGERITVELRIDPASEQEYYRGGKLGDGPPQLVLVKEEMWSRAAMTALVDDWDYTDDPKFRRFTVPKAPEPFVMHYYISDGRQGRATASLRFVPEDMSATP